MKQAIKAVALSDTQLRMLDIGAPVIVMCKTLTGETVAVRLQTRVLADESLEPLGTAASDAPGGPIEGVRCSAAAAGWAMHGAYVAVMPAGVDYGS